MQFLILVIWLPDTPKSSTGLRGTTTIFSVKYLPSERTGVISGNWIWDSNHTETGIPPAQASQLNKVWPKPHHDSCLQVLQARFAFQVKLLAWQMDEVTYLFSNSDGLPGLVRVCHLGLAALGPRHRWGPALGMEILLSTLWCNL